MKRADMTPLDDVRAKQELLHMLANAAEREGRMDAARALAEWADSLAPFQPLKAGAR